MVKRKLLSFILFVLFSPLLMAQNALQSEKDTTAQGKIDIYKEFSLTSFADEEPQKEIDSTKLSQHLIGVKWGFSLSNVAFSQDIAHKGTGTIKNFGLYYTYYHSLWQRMPYFGFQTGIEYNEIGYNHITEGNPEEDIPAVEQECLYQAIELPLLSQFRVDFWKMRLMMNIGPYGYYIISTNLEGGIPETTNRLGLGIMGGVGVAFVFHPMEFHIEGCYKYALSHFYTPTIYSSEYWVYTHANQIMLNFGVFFRLGGGKKR